MATGPRYKVPFRRRREGRTDYHQRLRLLISRENRLVVRRSAKHIRIQLVVPKPEGDSTLVSAISTELKKYGYEGSTGNTSAAYLTGLLFGKKALNEGYESGVLDMGLYSPSPGCRIYAALMGAVDAGLDIPHNPSVFPDEERIRGEHVAEHMDMAEFPEMFDASKEKILSDFN
ncbi:large subunit ribosomal protein L18 [Methanohalophilus levihalophilus]|uniref:50S ribosomal protein L18 n=1 Tax=Methanohalophilus levihalophilus TaxID=1431282 RepID=UPI001AE3B756|nr:50S ribosomal protein L18 [Methanohalophilus levihalophilus]MBP2029236.1 large subunit ribosomal protein L18 [Methanohalophilus levihalophilus]